MAAAAAAAEKSENGPTMERRIPRLYRQMATVAKVRESAQRQIKRRTTIKNEILVNCGEIKAGKFLEYAADRRLFTNYILTAAVARG